MTCKLMKDTVNGKEYMVWRSNHPLVHMHVILINSSPCSLSLDGDTTSPIYSFSSPYVSLIKNCFKNNFRIQKRYVDVVISTCTIFSNTGVFPGYSIVILIYPISQSFNIILVIHRPLALQPQLFQKPKYHV